MHTHLAKMADFTQPLTGVTTGPSDESQKKGKFSPTVRNGQWRRNGSVFAGSLTQRDNGTFFFGFSGFQQLIRYLRTRVGQALRGEPGVMLFSNHRAAVSEQLLNFEQCPARIQNHTACRSSQVMGSYSLNTDPSHQDFQATLYGRERLTTGSWVSRRVIILFRAFRQYLNGGLVEQDGITPFWSQIELYRE